LFDPMTLALWAFVLVSLLIWGRGTFCGWLCPFGALQELVGKLAQRLRIPQLTVRRTLDARLKLLKYLVLAAILGSVFISAELTDSLVEAEPFKTAITLNFVRSWPFVLYAGGLLAASAVVYKSFCRYLCPFGAGLRQAAVPVQRMHLAAGAVDAHQRIDLARLGQRVGQRQLGLARILMQHLDADHRAEGQVGSRMQPQRSGRPARKPAGGRLQHGPAAGSGGRPQSE
jgi:hypothetical protein